ncbi:MAG: transglycosylase family protein, partial [Mycobacteriales bacterium]
MSARSYRPKHRRPSKAKPALAISTMSTAFLISGASTASAATSDDFARLRQCESSGNYSINTGNGFYGAYQFDLQTWRGLGYSGLPSDAAPATQDKAARELQSQRGWQPWPSCSRQLGLRRGSSSTAAQKSTPVVSGDDTSVGETVDSAPAQPAVEVLPVGTALTPPPPPVQPFAIDTTGTPREDVRLWQEQMAKRGWDITVDGYHGAESARVAAAFIALKGLAGLAVYPPDVADHLQEPRQDLLEL